MSSVDSLLDRIRVVYAEVAEVEAVAERHPGDVFVLASLTSLKRQAEEFEQEWYELARVEQIEVCRYRLNSTLGFRYPAALFARSVENFQYLFSQIFDALENGPKQRSRLSAGVISETQFQFAYTYPGSLGVVLMMQGEHDLLSGKFDAAIEAVSQLMDIEDEDDVRTISSKLGEAVIRRVYDWSHQNVEAGFEVDMDWRSAGGVARGGHLDIDKMGKIVVEDDVVKIGIWLSA